MKKEDINSMFKTFEEAMSSWSQRPLSALFKAADESEDGIAYDRLVVGAITVALVLCIVHKGKNAIVSEKSSLNRKQPRSMLDNQTLAFLLNSPEAFTTTIMTELDDPATTLFASLNPEQIRKLESDFLQNVAVADSEQLGTIFPKQK